MTTPRDAIAGLIERLRSYEGRNFETTACYNGLRDEAAAQLAALKEERDEARKAANLGCDAKNGGAHSIMVERSYKFCAGCGETIRTPTLQERARAAEARATRIQQELDTSNDNHRAMAKQLARIGQERDEAIAALKPFVDVAEEMLSRGWDASNVALALDNPNEPHRVTAGDFFAIRRLAGPEKEGEL